LKQAAVAVQSGVCIDIFAVTDEYTDLASLKFLSIESGGSLFLYASTDDSTVPQDMYACLNEYFMCSIQKIITAKFPNKYEWSFLPFLQLPLTDTDC
jgi:hypothetical protein